MRVFPRVWHARLVFPRVWHGRLPQIGCCIKEPLASPLSVLIGLFLFILMYIHSSAIVMGRHSPAMLTCLLLLVLAVGCAARRCPLLHAAEGENKTGCYIVVLRQATTQEKFNEILQTATSMAEESRVYGVVRTVSKAFTVKLSAYSLNLVCCLHARKVHCAGLCMCRFLSFIL